MFGPNQTGPTPKQTGQTPNKKSDTTPRGSQSVSAADGFGLAVRGGYRQAHIGLGRQERDRARHGQVSHD